MSRHYNTFSLKLLINRSYFRWILFSYLRQINFNSIMFRIPATKVGVKYNTVIV